MQLRKSREKNYDVWLHWFVSYKCNFNCRYCHVSSVKAKANPVQTEKLLRTLNKTGKIFNVVFVGGEPFLTPNIIEVFEKLTKAHFISIGTNLVSPKINDFANKINPDKVVLVLASAHIKELERRSMLNLFFKNFKMLEKKGFILECVEVAHPSLLEEVDKYEKMFRKAKINLKFNPFVGEYNEKKYPEAYTEEEIKIFKLGEGNYFPLQFHFRYKKTCNVGFNVVMADAKGDIFMCNSLKSRLGNIYNEIKLNKNLVICPYKFCDCPFAVYDPFLYEKARLNAKYPPLNIPPSTLFINQVYNRLGGLKKMVNDRIRKEIKKEKANVY